MDDQRHNSMNMGMGYGRFAAMVATSTVVMFLLMYVNVYALGHIEFSQTRFWMAFVMGATMAVGVSKNALIAGTPFWAATT